MTGSGAERMWHIVNGFSAYWCVVAAIELGVFDALAEGAVTMDALADQLAVRPDRLATLVGGLAAHGLVARDSDVVALTAESRDHLVAGRPGYLGNLVRWSPGGWENWASLPATVTGDSPPAPPTPEFDARLVTATFATQLAVATALAPSVVPNRASPLRLLDVGAGLAPWTIAILQADPAATAVVNDHPEVLALAEVELTSRDLLPRVTLAPGDFRTIQLPGADLVVLGHVCRAEGAEAAPALIRRAGAAVGKNGRLIVTEYLVEDDWSGPITALCMGVTMMSNTGVGSTFTHAQLRHWLATESFDRIEHLTAHSTDVLVAMRRAS